MRSPSLSFSALAGSLRDLDAGKIILALQALRLRPIREAWREFWDIFGPGGKLHPGWFIEHQGHLVIEGGLMAIILVLFFQSGHRPSKEQEEEPLTEKVRQTARCRSLQHAWRCCFMQGEALHVSVNDDIMQRLLCM